MGSLYSDQHTWLHSVPAGVKLAFLALLGTSVFLTSSLFGLLASATGCVVIFASLGRATLRAKPLLLGYEQLPSRKKMLFSQGGNSALVTSFPSTQYLHIGS